MALVWFLARHALFGFVAAAVMTWWLFATDVAALRTLALQSDALVIAVIVLFFSLGLTFSSVAMGIAIMGTADRADPRNNDWTPDPQADPRFAANRTDVIDPRKD